MKTREKQKNPEKIENYERLLAEIVIFSSGDIITTSGGGDNGELGEWDKQ